VYFLSAYNQPARRRRKTHSDHCEDNAEGAKDGFGRCDTAELLRKIRHLDGHIERGENDVSAFLSELSVGIHGFEVDVAGGGVAPAGCVEESEPE
jgi:hypothetical protein